MRLLMSFISRVLFVGAFTLAGLAIGEKLANFVGYTLLRNSYTPGRLLEFSAVALLFVAALLLRDIRNLLRSKTP